MSTIIQLESLKSELETELYDRVLPFWEKYSPDYENGGYFNCLDRDGKIYDSTKHIWLQARQVWMFSKLYGTVHTNQKWFDIAKLGADFLIDHAKTDNHRVYFATNKEGEGKQIQRKIFSECFYVMALNEFGSISGQQRYITEAKQLLTHIWSWTKDLSKIGQLSYPGNTPSQSLAIPMILLNVFEEVGGSNWMEYESEIMDCIAEIKEHVDHKQQIVYETVTPSGKKINSIEGRLLNPGHAIEAGWFLLRWAQKLGRTDFHELAFNMIDWSYTLGWDTREGGLFYFLDADGYSPIPLEWDMKLWWPHTEAMYAWMLRYEVSGQKADLKRFQEVKEFAFTHFSDPEYGEWFGYLNRAGEITHRFKGGPYKGCFHVPRALYLCIQSLEKIGQKSV